MTVRDGARYIAQALDSVLAQTFTDWELVLWDDGSTDDTPAVIRGYDDPRIRTHASEPIGRRRALVEAHRLAHGRSLGWIDADDHLAPEALARAHEVLAGCDLVYTDHIVIGPTGEHRGLGKRSAIPYSARRLLIDFTSFHFRLFSRDVFERAGGISDYEIAIDYDLCLRISECGRVKHLAEPLYFYREHDQQLSTRKRAEQIAASARAIRAALARRKMSYELVVENERFRLARVAKPIQPPASEWLRIAAATVTGVRGERASPGTVVGYWPARVGTYWRLLHAAADARGFDLRAIGGSLAQLMRAVWSGSAGDTLVIHDLAPLLDGEPAANRLLFAKTLDHARARGTRIVWISAGPHREERVFAGRCDAIVTHWQADLDRLRALGKVVFVPYPNLVAGYPEVSQDSAREQLGLAERDVPTILYLDPLAKVELTDLVLADVDRSPRDTALRFAAAELVVLPRELTSSTLVLAMAMGKPLVAPASASGIASAFLYGEHVADAIERARDARDDWDRMARENRERVSTWSVEAVLAAVVG